MAGSVALELSCSDRRWARCLVFVERAMGAISNKVNNPGLGQCRERGGRVARGFLGNGKGRYATDLSA